MGKGRCKSNWNFNMGICGDSEYGYCRYREDGWKCLKGEIARLKRDRTMFIPLPGIKPIKPFKFPTFKDTSIKYKGTTPRGQVITGSIDEINLKTGGNVTIHKDKNGIYKKY